MKEKVRSREPLGGHILLTEAGVKQVYMVCYEDSAGVIRNRYEFGPLLSERTLWRRVEEAHAEPGNETLEKASLHYWAYRALDPIRVQVWEMMKKMLEWFQRIDNDYMEGK